MTALFLSVSVTLGLFTSVHNQPTFIENDSIVFPDNDTATSNISEKLKACLQDGLKIEFNGECHVLLTNDNICPNRYWLVLDLPSASLPTPIIRGKCAPRVCEPNFHYWTQQKRCVHSNESSSLCPRGNYIKTDFFGDGFCECISNPIHARDRSGACYPVFKRGPCTGGKVWTPVNGRMECRADNCEGVRDRLVNQTIVPSWVGENRCYEVGTKGPCKQGLVVTVNMNPPYNLYCSEPLALLAIVDPPCLGTDHAGKCTGSVNTPHDTFLNQIRQQASKKRARKSTGSPK